MDTSEFFNKIYEFLWKWISMNEIWNGREEWKHWKQLESRKNGNEGRVKRIGGIKVLLIVIVNILMIKIGMAGKWNENQTIDKTLKIRSYQYS